MNKDLCATLNTTELERDVLVNITSDASLGSANAQSSMLGIYVMTAQYVIQIYHCNF